MNVRHLAELAGLLSVHALQIVESPRPVSGGAARLLREISQKRADAWTSRMQSLGNGAHLWSSLYAEDPRRELLEEILVSEILSRVTAGLLTVQSQLSGEKTARLLAADLFNDHQLARRSALTQMLEMADAHDPLVRKLDKLRRLAERWTDIFLGPLACRFSIGHLVFDPLRAEDYGQTILPYLTLPVGSGLFQAGLSVAFPKTLTGVPAHAGYHRDMAAGVLRLLPEDIFDSDGGLLPLRTVRSLRFKPTTDTQPVESRRRNPVPQKIPPAAQTPCKLSFRQLRHRPQKP